MSNYADEIKARVPMADLCGSIGLEVNRQGYARCPFHGEKTASLRIYQGAGGWHCYGCHKGGDVIDFVREYYGLTYPQALVRLNDDFALGLSIGSQLTARERRAAEQARMARMERERAGQRKRDEALLDWCSAFDFWLRLERLRQEHMPRARWDPLSDQYAFALHHLPEARDTAQRADDALRELERSGTS